VSDEDLLIYPTEKVVGVIADREQLDAVHAALDERGVGQDRIEVLCGDQGQERLDPDADQQGAFGKMIRTVQKALGDEAIRLEKLNQALEAGHYVIKVGLSEEEDDDAREQEKQSIGAALRGVGATKVAFYGQYQIEELQVGA
jgi:hypothetical protein